MPDNLGYTPGTGATVSTEEVTTLNGSAVTAQHLQRMAMGISTANGVGIDLPGDVTNGLDVDVTRVGGNVTVVQPTAGNLNANVSGTVTANAGTGNFTVAQATAANLQATATLAAGTAYAGRVRLTDGTNDITLDTAYNDAGSNTETHYDVGSRPHGYNGTTWDRMRTTTTQFKCATYVAAQTGTALWTPAAGRAVAVTAIQIQSYGTTAGTCIVWFGGSADTTYNRGTDAAVFDGEFAPSTTSKPGVYIAHQVHPRGAADFVLRVTTTNAQSVTVNVWGYEV